MPFHFQGERPILGDAISTKGMSDSRTPMLRNRAPGICKKCWISGHFHHVSVSAKTMRWNDLFNFRQRVTAFWRTLFAKIVEKSPLPGTPRSRAPYCSFLSGSNWVDKIVRPIELWTFLSKTYRSFLTESRGGSRFTTPPGCNVSLLPRGWNISFHRGLLRFTVARYAKTP